MFREKYVHFSSQEYAKHLRKRHLELKESNTNTAKQRLENNVADINLWMTTNKLKLNNDKSEFLSLHSRFRHSLSPPTISVGMENISPPQQARNLGVIFDDTMSLSHMLIQ